MCACRPPEHFHGRLLELLPIYTATGQRLARLDPTAPAGHDEALAWALADRACRSWLRGTIPPHADMLDAIVHAIESLDPVSDPSTAMDAVEVARDTRLIAEPIPGTDEIVATARLAEAVAYAAASGDHPATGRAAAECLFSRRAHAGDKYLIGEAAAVLAVP